MTNLDEMKIGIQEEWDDAIVPLSLKLFDFLCSEPLSRLKMLSLLKITKILEKDTFDNQVIFAVDRLTTTRFHALDRKLLFIDDDNEEYLLQEENVSHFLNEGRLVHPTTGEYVEDADEKVVPFFVPSKMFVAMRESVDNRPVAHQ